jgi:hypothetical protein
MQPNPKPVLATKIIVTDAADMDHYVPADLDADVDGT